ncbi:hypothetical protein EYF80_000778 [Liparis tanakae]|uniref:Uncharacterized protein n=1 Tax=Liparis tanakae TaxID=230148 RepID=A0A4Z2JFF0_9TELE|nr:hypothetical protein EYF80_000778 [Liparis tanakae]
MLVMGATSQSLCAPNTLHMEHVGTPWVPLQPVNTVPVQNHLVSAGRASEAAAGRQRAPSCWKLTGISADGINVGISLFEPRHFVLHGQR